ncbi:MAG: apolipoprotein N-acyltransferase [Thermodesulfobacteriota bacterium]|nr:apolipoprotein N-acyltransferase [Thermodesulfobacteriota bacterium]
MRTSSDCNPSDVQEIPRALSASRVLLAVLSGFLLTGSFPPGKLEWVSWFALVPLLKGLEGERPKGAFKLGLIAGAAHYLTLMWWIVLVLGHYGNLNIYFSLGPFLLLCIYLALYPAFFSSLIPCLKGSRFAPLFMACLWVGLEYVRARLLTGFPWCLLGYTQYKHLHLIQVADLFGVYGLSFLIVFSNAIVYCLLFKRHVAVDSFLGKGFQKSQVAMAVFMLGGTIAYGHYCLSEFRVKKESRQCLRAAVIQGNIDQSVKWDPAYQDETLAIYKRLTRSTYGFEPELIVWPETSVPFFFQNDPKFSPEVFSLVKESGATLIFGSPAYRQLAGMTRYYNRAYMIAPDGQPPQYYDKVHLVPFGEYVPLKKYLSFVNRLVPAAGDFEPGDKIVTLDRDVLRMGVLVCFEAIFPELARTHKMLGANLLVNITNDAWFGRTSAPYQHLSMAVFRAVENRTPLIRAANTGFSAFILPQGEIAFSSALFSQQTLNACIDISSAPPTFYARTGDLFPCALLLISFIKIISYLWTKRHADK